MASVYVNTCDRQNHNEFSEFIERADHRSSFLAVDIIFFQPVHLRLVDTIGCWITYDTKSSNMEFVQIRGKFNKLDLFLKSIMEKFNYLNWRGGV